MTAITPSLSKGINPQGKGSKGKVTSKPGKGHPCVKKRARERDPNTGKCIRSQKRSHKAQQKRDLRKRLHQVKQQVRSDSAVVANRSEHPRTNRPQAFEGKALVSKPLSSITTNRVSPANVLSRYTLRGLSLCSFGYGRGYVIIGPSPRVVCLAQPSGTIANAEQIQSLASQVQQLTAQLTSQQQELNNTRTALEQQAQATNAALTVARSAVSQLTATTQSTTSAEPKRRPLNPKLVNAPEPFTGSDSDWERFKFGFTSWIGTVDPEYPDLLKFAAAQTDEINPAEMIPVAKVLCADLFAILVGLYQSQPSRCL